MRLKKITLSFRFRVDDWHLRRAGFFVAVATRLEYANSLPIHNIRGKHHVNSGLFGGSRKEKRKGGHDYLTGCKVRNHRPIPDPRATCPSIVSAYSRSFLNPLLDDPGHVGDPNLQVIQIAVRYGLLPFGPFAQDPKNLILRLFDLC